MFGITNANPLQISKGWCHRDSGTSFPDLYWG